MAKQTAKAARSKSRPKHGKRARLQMMLIAAVAVASVLLLWCQTIRYLHAVGSGMNHAPREWSFDDVDYDNLAFSILYHGTYAFDWDLEPWRLRYEQFNGSGYYDPVLRERHGYGITTYKPPLGPMLMAASYKVFGTSFFVGRSLNVLLMSIGVFAAILFAGWFAGLPAALLTAAFIFLRPNTVMFASMLMTESVATFSFTLTFILFYFFLRSLDGSSKPLLSVATGVSLGVLALSRSLYLVWIPFLVLASALEILLRHRSPRRREITYRWAILFLSCAAVLSPWFLRNAFVTGSVSPLDNEGSHLIGAYSDESYQLEGEWAFAPFINAYQDFESSDPVIRSQAPAAREAARAKYFHGIALSWIRDHWLMLPSLMFRRVYYAHYAHTLPHQAGNDAATKPIVNFLLILGAIGWFRRPLGFIFAGAMIIDALVISLLWDSTTVFLTAFIPVLSITTAGILFLPEYVGYVVPLGLRGARKHRGA